MRILLISIAGPPKITAESIQVKRLIEGLTLESNIDLKWVSEYLVHDGYQYAIDSDSFNFKGEVIRLKARNGKLVERIYSLVAPSTLKKPDVFHLFFSKSNIQEVSKIASSCDVMISRSQPISSAILANEVYKRTGVPWLMHLSDPWLISPFHNQETTEWSKKKERELMSNCSYVSFTTEEALKAYSDRYPNLENKATVFPNLVNTNIIEVDKNIGRENFKIVYTGNFYQSRSPEHLIEALGELARSSPEIANQIIFEFAGQCSDAWLNKLSSMSVKFVNHGVLSPKECVGLQREANLLVTIDAKTPGQYYFFPSKVLDYAGSGRPILGITDEESPTSKLINDGLGRTFPHDQSGAISDYIIKLFEGKILVDYDPKRVLSKFSVETNIPKLIQILEEISRK